MRDRNASFPAEYQKFLQRCPDWLRKHYLGETPTIQDVQAYVDSDSAVVAAFHTQHDELLARYPKLRKQWEGRVGKGLTSHVKRSQKVDHARKRRRLKQSHSESKDRATAR